MGKKKKRRQRAAPNLSPGRWASVVRMPHSAAACCFNSTYFFESGRSPTKRTPSRGGLPNLTIRKRYRQRGSASSHSGWRLGQAANLAVAAATCSFTDNRTALAIEIPSMSLASKTGFVGLITLRMRDRCIVSISLGTKYLKNRGDF